MGKSWKRLVQRRRRAASEVEAAPVAEEAPAAAPKVVKPAPAKELSAAAKDFDRAFAAAREKGEKTFPWRGKTYTTKYKGE